MRIVGCVCKSDPFLPWGWLQREVDQHRGWSLKSDRLTSLNVDVPPADNVIEVVNTDDVQTSAFLGAVGWVWTDETKHPERAIELLARGGICEHDPQHQLASTQIWRNRSSEYYPTSVGLIIKELRSNPGAAPTTLTGVCTCSSDRFGVDRKHAASGNADGVAIRGLRYLGHVHVQLVSRCCAAGERGFLP